MTVLVLVDHHGGAPRPSALELVTLARDLGDVAAVWVGADPAQGLHVLGAHGAATVHHVAADDAAPAPVLARALADVAGAAGATTVLLTSTFENKEVAALVARELGAGLAVDVVAVERTAEGAVTTVQQAFAATWTLRSEVLVERAVVTVKPASVTASPVDGDATPAVVSHAGPAVDLRGVRVVERTERPSSGRPALTEATVVVVGGRGTDGDFGAVEELADVLGGAVGATRVATDEGWIGHEAQIGQTGVTISPRLYVGAGVSGAVHHRGGMQSSGTIVAVNADPEAPIFEIADFGVVGDLFTVLPQAAAEVRRLREQA